MDPIARARLRTQGLGEPLAKATPADVVRLLLCVQSQDYLGGKWSVAQRLEGVTNAALDRALDEGRILRTHILRPTWHFVLPEDIRWLLALTSPRVLAQNASVARRFELGATQLKRGLDAIQRELEGGHWRTREELGAAAERRARLKALVGTRLAYLVMQAELEGLIASGPRRGKQFTYGLLEERAPAKADRSPRTSSGTAREEALGRLATRYFAGHGPATARDLARWATLTLADAQRAVDAAGRSLTQERAGGGGAPLFTTADAARLESPAARGVGGDLLLCVYDEYVNGYRDRSAIFDPTHAAEITGRGMAVTHVYTVDGQVRGTWSRVLGRTEVAISLDPFDKRVALRALRRRLAPAAEAYGRFLELEPRIGTR